MWNLFTFFVWNLHVLYLISLEEMPDAFQSWTLMHGKHMGMDRMASCSILGCHHQIDINAMSLMPCHWCQWCRSLWQLVFFQLHVFRFFDLCLPFTVKTKGKLLPNNRMCSDSFFFQPLKTESISPQVLHHGQMEILWECAIHQNVRHSWLKSCAIVPFIFKNLNEMGWNW